MADMFGTRALGIEVSGESLTLTCLSRGAAGIRVVACETLPFRRGEANEEAVATLKQFVIEHGVAMKRVGVALPARRALLRFMDIQAPSRELLAGLIHYEIERHMPFDPADVFYDFQVVASKGQEHRIALAIVPREEVLHIIAFLKEIPLIPEWITISLFSSLNAIEFSNCAMPLWKRLAGCRYRSGLGGDGNGEAALWVVLGQSEYELAVFDKGSVYGASSLPVVEGLSKEDLWQRFVAEIDRGQLLPPGSKISSVVLAGDGAEPLSGPFNRAAVLPVYSITSFSGFSPQQASVAVTPFLSSVGAALSTFELGTVNINLRPGGKRKKLKVGALVSKIAASASIILLLAIGTSAMVKERQALQNINAAIQKNTPGVKAIEKALAGLEALGKQKKYLTGPEVRNVGKVDLLAELSNIVPSDAWITNLDYKEVRNQPRVVGEIVITGFARYSSRLIPLLENSPYFKGVEFVGQVTKSTLGEGFRIRALVEEQVVN
jgi:hypothetical protein